jgi:hypothetical protein
MQQATFTISDEVEGFGTGVLSTVTAKGPFTGNTCME